jgi:dipeptidyl aminopeptidase/acylaminoacyl peptidase
METRETVIWSDGTRMAADLYLPDGFGAGDRRPAVVWVSGTQGTRKGTPRQLGPIFAKNGYVFLGFDYRGWGDSESIVTTLDPQPRIEASAETTIRVRAHRWQHNYTDQTQDIRAAISYVAGEPSVDPERIGIIGTSYGGGLATWVAGNDPRVKVAVIQVGGVGRRGAAYWQEAYRLATRQARGETEPVPFETGKSESFPKARYNNAKNIGFDNVQAVQRINIPFLALDADKDEYGSNTKWITDALRERGVPVEYHVLPMTHYDVYRGKFEEATQIELAWFDRHLKATQAAAAAGGKQ